MVTVKYKEKEKTPKSIFELPYDEWYRLVLDNGAEGVGIRKFHALGSGCLFLIKDEGSTSTWTNNDVAILSAEKVDLDITVTTASGRPS